MRLQRSSKAVRLRPSCASPTSPATTRMRAANAFSQISASSMAARNRCSPCSPSLARTRQCTTRSPSRRSSSRSTKRPTNPVAPVSSTSRTAATGTGGAGLPSPMARRTNARRLSRSRWHCGGNAPASGAILLSAAVAACGMCRANGLWRWPPCPPGPLRRSGSGLRERWRRRRARGGRRGSPLPSAACRRCRRRHHLHRHPGRRS